MKKLHMKLKSAKGYNFDGHPEFKKVGFKDALKQLNEKLSCSRTNFRFTKASCGK